MKSRMAIACLVGLLGLQPVRPATFTVTTTADSGAGSLRQAVADAVAAAGDDTIRFDAALAGETIYVGSPGAILFSGASAILVDGSTLWMPVVIQGSGSRQFTLSNASNVTVRKLRFVHGSSSEGGAVYGQGTLTAEDCVFENNAATGSGGAIYGTATARLSVTRCLFSGNRAGEFGYLGGAIYSQGPVTIDRSTFTGGVARQGGAVATSSTSLQISQSTFFGNTAASGGAIWMGGNGGPNLLSHVTITGNHATGASSTYYGGGVYCADTTSWTLRNSIVSGNTLADSIEDIHTGNNLTYAGANLVKDTWGGSTGPAPSAAPPLLAALGDHGGPTPTMPPEAGSPAADAAIGSLVTTDQRGVSISGVPDLGACEQGSALEGLDIFTVTEDSTATERTIPYAIPLYTGTPVFSATSTNPGLITGYTHGGSGTNRTVRPLVPANASGEATITVTHGDGVASGSYTFHLVITPLNDAPRFTKGSNQSVSMNRRPITVTNWATGLNDADPESTQELQFLVTNNNNALFSAQPTIAPNGTLTYTLAPWRSGIATLTVRLQDNGSGVAPHANLSAAQTATVTINTPTTLMVTTTDDSGPGSLRNVIIEAQISNGSRGILFDPVLSGQTITLNSEIAFNSISLVRVLSIDASFLPGGLTIDGGSGSNRIFRLGPSDTIALRGVTLRGGEGGSTVNNRNGGAVYNYFGNLALTQCTLMENSAGTGGAVHNLGVLELNQSFLHGNEAQEGGAIRNEGQLILSRCTVAGNSAGFFGGAIDDDGNTATMMDQCEFTGNSAVIRGGAIHSPAGATQILTRCVFEGNLVSGYSSTGGALYNESGMLHLTQCTLWGNTATNVLGVGGAISITSSGSALTLIQSTVAGNSAGRSGGAIYQSTGPLILISSLIAGNTAPLGSDLYSPDSTVLRQGANLIGNNNGVSSSFPAGLPNALGDYAGTSGAPLNPLVSSLGDHGGSTRTLRLLPGSPAINRIPIVESEFQLVVVGSNANQFSLAFGGASTPQMAHWASAASVQSALNALPTIGGVGGSVAVTGGNQAFAVAFNGGSLAGVNQPLLTGTAGNGARVTVTGLVDGTAGAPAPTTATTDQRGFPIVGLRDIGAYENGARALGPIEDHVVLVGGGFGAIPFSLDPEDNGAAPLVLSAISDTPAFLPLEDVTLGGGGTNRTVSVMPVPGQPGSSLVTLTVTDGHDPTSTTFRVSVLADTPYNAWKLAAFGQAAGTPAVAGDGVDADADGIPTFAEYALRGLPLSSTPTPLGHPLLVAGPARELVFPYRPGEPRLRYIVERTANLANPAGWGQVFRYDSSAGAVHAPGVTSSLDSLAQRITLTDSADGPAYYWRLLIEDLGEP